MALLSDNQYLEFLSQGFLTIQPSTLSESDHDTLYQRAFDLYQQNTKLKSPKAHLELLGDNLRSLVPEIDKILNDSAVDDAIRSILGDHYILHPHHYVHKSLKVDQVFHQDGNLPWNERGHYRSHRPDWLMLFYYPQNVDSTNGPTEIVRGTQYWTKNFETKEGWHSNDSLDRDFQDVMSSDDLSLRDQRQQKALNSLGVPDLKRDFIHVPKGSAVIGNYDLIHRGSRKLPGSAPRFMYKFYFARSQEPTSPSWAHSQQPNLTQVRSEIRPVIKQIWEWSLGRKAEEALNDAATVIEQLNSGAEHHIVEAAYRLGMWRDPRAVTALLNGLRSESEATRRASAYGLRIQGKAATHGIVTALLKGSAQIRRVAAYALGTTENAGSKEALDVLVACIEKDPDDLARSNAAYSIGHIARSDDCDSLRIAEFLSDRLQPGIEPHNTDVAGLSRSTVRQSLGYALTLLISNHDLPDELMDRISVLATADDDRYVSGMLIQGLMHTTRATPMLTLLKGLEKQRWWLTP